MSRHDATLSNEEQQIINLLYGNPTLVLDGRQLNIARELSDLGFTTRIVSAYGHHYALTPAGANLISFDR